MSKILNGKRNNRSTLAPKTSRIGGKPDHHWSRDYILFLMVRNKERAEDHPLNIGAKIRRIKGKHDRHWCRYEILFLMSEIRNGRRNNRPTLAPEISCIGGERGHGWCKLGLSSITFLSLVLSINARFCHLATYR